MVKILQITLFVMSFFAIILGGLTLFLGGFADAPSLMAGGLILLSGGVYVMVKTLETMEEKINGTHK